MIISTTVSEGAAAEILVTTALHHPVTAALVTCL